MTSDRIIYNAASGAVLYDPDGTGGQAATQFAMLSQGLALSGGHFKII
jgi:Ca2+-binding RTX toxin-like protein